MAIVRAPTASREPPKIIITPENLEPIMVGLNSYGSVLIRKPDGKFSPKKFELASYKVEDARKYIARVMASGNTVYMMAGDSSSLIIEPDVPDFSTTMHRLEMQNAVMNLKKIEASKKNIDNQVNVLKKNIDHLKGSKQATAHALVGWDEIIRDVCEDPTVLNVRRGPLPAIGVSSPNALVVDYLPVVHFASVTSKTPNGLRITSPISLSFTGIDPYVWPAKVWQQHPHLKAGVLCQGYLTIVERQAPVPIMSLIRNLVKANDIRGMVSMMGMWRLGWEMSSELNHGWAQRAWGVVLDASHYQVSHWLGWDGERVQRGDTGEFTTLSDIFGSSDWRAKTTNALAHNGYMDDGDGYGGIMPLDLSGVEAVVLKTLCPTCDTGRLTSCKCHGAKCVCNLHIISCSCSQGLVPTSSVNMAYMPQTGLQGVVRVKIDPEWNLKGCCYYTTRSCFKNSEYAYRIINFTTASNKTSIRANRSRLICGLHLLEQYSTLGRWVPELACPRCGIYTIPATFKWDAEKKLEDYICEPCKKSKAN